MKSGLVNAQSVGDLNRITNMTLLVYAQKNIEIYLKKQGVKIEKRGVKMKNKSTNDCPKEAFEQQRFCQWLEAHDILYFAIPNQSNRKMPKNAPYIGVKPGVPDLMICEPSYFEAFVDINSNVIARSKPYDYCGLFIEMKRLKRSYPTLDQKIWIKKLNDKGYVAKVAHGCDEAIAITKDYLGWEE